MRPRDYLDLTSAPIRIAIALAALLVAAVAFLAKKPRILLPVSLTVAIGGSLISILSSERPAPRVEVVFTPNRTHSVIPRSARSQWGDPSAVPYPCGAQGSISRLLGGNPHWTASASVLLAIEDRPEPDFEGTLLSPNGESLRATPNLRALVAGASSILGEPARVAVDPARGILRIAPEPSR